MLALEKEEQGRLLLAKSIVQRAINSVGSREYHELYISRSGDEIEEVIKSGEFACAYQSTVPFHNFGLLEFIHTTVDGFEAEVRPRLDWIQTDTPLAGAIGILEGKIHTDGSVQNRHTFICIGNGEAVHSEADPLVRCLQRVKIDDFRHHTGAYREVEAYYIHKKILAEI